MSSILITGTNQGVGLELTKRYAADADTEVVYVGIRNVNKPSAELQKVADSSKKVVILQLDSAQLENAESAAKIIAEKTGRLDLVIANAGVAGELGTKVLDMDVKALERNNLVNSVAVVALFQATYPLLKKSKKPRFVAISTKLASLSEFIDANSSAYGASKAQSNYLIREIHAEHSGEGLIAIAAHPGLVQTNMATDFIQRMGGAASSGAISPAKSAELLHKLFDSLTIEHGGKLYDNDGTVYPF